MYILVAMRGIVATFRKFIQPVPLPNSLHNVLSEPRDITSIGRSAFRNGLPTAESGPN